MLKLNTLNSQAPSSLGRRGGVKEVEEREGEEEEGEEGGEDGGGEGEGEGEGEAATGGVDNVGLGSCCLSHSGQHFLGDGR